MNRTPYIVHHLQTDGFTAYTVRNHNETMQYGGHDGYHKIVLISGIGEIKYNHHVYKVKGSALLITRPGISCTWYLSGASHVTYVCAFKKNFLNINWITSSRNCDQHFSLHPVTLNTEQEEFVRAIFCRMIDEQKTTYAFRQELLKNQLCVLTHTAFRMVASRKCVHSRLVTKPTAAVSLELVEFGFPLVGQVLHFN